MTWSAPVPDRSAARRAGAADRWINYAAATTVAGLAGIAGALSYSHMRQLAQDHGEVGWHAHAFPLSVDGVEIVASLVLLADRRAGHRSGWLPWAALAAGTTGSLAANIATAHPDLVSRIIAGWPALALLLAVKLLSGILERSSVPAAADQASQAREHASTDASVPGMVSADPLETPAHLQPAKIRIGSAEPRDSQPPSSLPAADPAPGSRLTALLPAAQAARDELSRDGLPLTRDALAARLRQHGTQSATPASHHYSANSSTKAATTLFRKPPHLKQPASQSGSNTGHRRRRPTHPPPPVPADLVTHRARPPLNPKPAPRGARSPGRRHEGRIKRAIASHPCHQRQLPAGDN